MFVFTHGLVWGLYWGKRDSRRELGWEAEGPSLKTSPAPAQGSRAHRREPMGDISPANTTVSDQAPSFRAVRLLSQVGEVARQVVTAAKADDVRLTPRTHTGRRPPQAVMACPCSHTHRNE